MHHLLDVRRMFSPHIVDNLAAWIQSGIKPVAATQEKVLSALEMYQQAPEELRLKMDEWVSSWASLQRLGRVVSHERAAAWMIVSTQHVQLKLIAGAGRRGGG